MTVNPNGFKISAITTLPASCEMPDRYVTRLTAKHALYSLISMLDDVRQYFELEMNRLSHILAEADLRPWIRAVEDVEAKLDATISLHRNSQLDTFLSFGLQFTFSTPDGKISVFLDQNR